MNNHPQQTLILICNSGHAKWFVNNGPKDGVHEMREDEHFIPKTTDIMTGERGRNRAQSQAAQHHAYEPPTDPRKKEKREFVEEIAEAINRREKTISRLLVVAPPEALHVLREHLSPGVKQKLIGEINKDLTHENESTLPQHLTPHMRLYDPQHDFTKSGAGEFGAA